MMANKHFFIVAGEASGDILGARLMKSLKVHYPQASFQGIGGELMLNEGLQSLFPMERLSIIGIIPILKRLPELLNMRRKLARIILNAKPDCFIGIDAPEFNLGLEYKLKQNGITTVHYVSPSVWAWRENRIFKIAKSVSLMLCLFPFELPIYKRHNIPAVCIGHPLANEIPLRPDTNKARKKLALPIDKTIVALLPGSRGSEVKYLIEPFFKTAEKLKQKYPAIQFVLPCANEKRRAQIERAIEQFQIELPLQLVDGQSRDVMQAADVVLLASGTATLEAMLLKKPMVVAYKMSDFSLWIYQKFLKISQFSIPNLIASEPIVQELMQNDCEPELLFKAVDKLFENKSQVIKKFEALHKGLQLGGSEKAADAIIALINKNNKD